MCDSEQCLTGNGTISADMHQRSQRQAGFTLLELIIALAISAILLGLALPSFRSLMGDSKMTSTSNALVFALQTARSEAIKRSMPVALCASATPLAADATCGGSGYGNGWVVYADENSNGSLDGDEFVVLQVDSPGPGFTFTPQASVAAQVWFNDVGSSSNPAGIPLSGNILISYGDGEEQRRVIVSANGRISTETPL